MLADFSLYNISLWLHISSAVVGLGATFALADSIRKYSSGACAPAP